jgi:hypothetical protein
MAAPEAIERLRKGELRPAPRGDGAAAPARDPLARLSASRVDEARQDGNVELASHLAALAEGLHDYVGEGAVMFAIVEHLARRSQRARESYGHRGRWAARTFLVIDEGWKMLECRSTGRWINEHARRSRHNRLFLVASSQSLSDFTRHPEGHALVSQSSIQLLLTQLPGQTTEIQKELGLTDEEAATISQLRTRKGEGAEAFLCNGRRGRGLVEIHAGELEYWIATSEPDHDQPLRQRVLAQVGGDPRAAVRELARNHQPRSER